MHAQLYELPSINQSVYKCTCSYDVSLVLLKQQWYRKQKFRVGYYMYLIHGHAIPWSKGIGWDVDILLAYSIEATCKTFSH